MRTRVAAFVVLCLAVTTLPASAQYTFRGASNRATGETYRVEVGGFFWDATPEIFITSESLDILGSRIDFVEELGIEKKRLSQVRVVLRPGTKHKFRFEYTPIKYTAQSVLRRDIVFAGTTFTLALPVATDFAWRAYRFGYEYDFVYRDRGFVGLVLEAKYTDVETTLSNVIRSEFIRARAPIPAIGLIGRGYVTSNISITGEFTFFRWPDSVDEDYAGRFYDFDLYGTANFTDNFGIQGGYRSFDVFYKVEGDEGEFTLKGIYIGAVARF